MTFDERTPNSLHLYSFLFVLIVKFLGYFELRKNESETLSISISMFDGIDKYVPLFKSGLK